MWHLPRTKLSIVTSKNLRRRIKIFFRRLPAHFFTSIKLNMKEIALYALLNGVSFTAELHKIEETTIRKWITELDYDNDPFFLKIRELVYKAASKAGIGKASELFSVPEATINILMHDFSRLDIEEIEEMEASDANPDVYSKKLAKSMKKSALAMFIKGKPESEIAVKLSLPLKRIRGWISSYSRFKTVGVKKLKKKHKAQPTPSNVLVDSDVEEIKSDTDDEVMEIAPEKPEILQDPQFPVDPNLESFANEDQFDEILKWSKY